MTSRFRNPQVRAYDWRDPHGATPMIRIDNGPVFIMLHYDDARHVVDQVHDLCDEHERQQREGVTDG